MKLIRHFVDPAEASEVCARLRAAGIMSEVNSLDPHVIKPSKSGSVRVGLWVIFDEQHDDAVQLLDNPDHIPRQIMTPEEMNKIKPSAADASQQPNKKRAETATTLLLMACLFGLIIYTVIQFIFGV